MTNYFFESYSTAGKLGNVFILVDFLKELDLYRDNYANFNSEERDNLRWKLVSWRDNGRLVDALNGFVAAHYVWPADERFTLEILIIVTRYFSAEYASIHRFIAQIQSSSNISPVLSLIISLFYCNNGQFCYALPYVNTFLKSEFDLTWQFRNEQQEFLRKFIYFINSQADNEQRINIDLLGDDAIKVCIDRFLLNADRLNLLFDELRHIVNMNIFSLERPHTEILNNIKSVYNQFSLKGKSEVIGFYISFKFFDLAKDAILSLLNDNSSRYSTSFTKWACYYAMEIGDELLERRILSQFVSEKASAGNAVDAAQRKEIFLRKQSLLIDRKIHIFVGLFGQMRAYDETLKHIKEYIDSSLITKNGKYVVHYGVSTWEKGGGRVLNLDDIAPFFYERVPYELKRVLEETNAITGNELYSIFPNITQKIIEHSALTKTENIELNSIVKYLGSECSVLIDDDTEIDYSIEKMLQTESLEMDKSCRNQFKMWSRIKRLQDALYMSERRYNIGMDACIFLRSDLKLSGNIIPLIERSILKSNDKLLMSDFDGNAELIEGAGDRYFIGSRRAMGFLFDVYDYYAEIFSARSENKELRTRITGHQNIRSFIFSKGLHLKTVDDISYEIYRGVISIDELSNPIKLDMIQDNHFGRRLRQLDINHR